MGIGARSAGIAERKSVNVNEAYRNPIDQKISSTGRDQKNMSDINRPQIQM